MNDKVQNRVVKQKDIMKIINILNDFYKEKMEVFNKTKAEIEEEEREYAEWRNNKFNAENYSEYPEFQYKTHYNKLTYGTFTFTFHCIDGTTYEDKPYAEAQNILAAGFSNYEKISVRLDLSWHKTYHQEKFFDDSNNANVSASITFFEDDVYTNYSSKNADGDMKLIKSEISDVFDSLKPKYSDIISKRESIKYQSTLTISYMLSLVFISVIAFSGMEIEFKWWPMIAFPILTLLINVFVPKTKMIKLYKQIIPKQKTVYANRQTLKIDNIKEYQRTSEVHIGSNATKSGKREQIEDLHSKQKSLNFIVLVFAIIALFVVSGII